MITYMYMVIATGVGKLTLGIVWRERALPRQGFGGQGRLMTVNGCSLMLVAELEWLCLCDEYC